MPAEARSNEIRITRVYEAPAQAVWEAWTDPDQVARWWGPRGFTLTTHSKDLRVGGSWIYTMHGPDGVDYPNRATYLEVEEGRRLVYDHGANDEREALFRVTVVFSEKDGRTTMQMSMALATPEAAEETKKFIKKAGGNATWDRLAEYLAKESSGSERFVIHRSFGVPIHTMFEMWTDVRHLCLWLPPTGFRMEFLRSDLREGASVFYVMSNDAGVKFYGRNHYLEISPPTRLAYTQQFCDEGEAVSRHPMATVWPGTMRTTVTLTGEGPDQTRVMVVSEPCGDVSREELEAFVTERTGMTGGWTGSFDKLEELLS
jgi:uncharacterized protein YndB with AHSA1/START domain